MDRQDVDVIVSDAIEEIFRYKQCPKCKKTAGFIRFEVSDDEDTLVRGRCMNCLALIESTTKLIEG